MRPADEKPEVTREEVERVFRKLDQEAESAGYHLNPDREVTLGLIEGMLVNERRYGYWACPCRLASGKKTEDLDIICPCDYRDADLTEYGACFCALYVSADIKEGRRKATRVPERRPAELGAGTGDSPETPSAAESPPAGAPPRVESAAGSGPDMSGLRYPVWRCKVCGYLCGRDGPPEVCPICKAKKERFERFL